MKCFFSPIQTYSVQFKTTQNGYADTGFGNYRDPHTL